MYFSLRCWLAKSKEVYDGLRLQASSHGEVGGGEGVGGGGGGRGGGEWLGESPLYAQCCQLPAWLLGLIDRKTFDRWEKIGPAEHT